MKIIINRSAIMQYLLIYLMYIAQDSVLFNLNALLFSYIILAICIGAILYNHIRVNSNLYFTLAAIILNIIIVRLLFGGVGITVFWKWSAFLFIAYTTYYFQKKMFIQRYVKLVLFFAIISLIYWTLTLIIPNIVRSLTVFHLKNPNYNNTVFDGLFLYITRDNVTKNVGIFGESGLFQIVLNTALYFTLFCRQQLNFVKKGRLYAIFLLMITILTTQSTTGYIAMLAIVSIYLIGQRDAGKVRFMLCGLVVALILTINYYSAGNDSFISNVVVKKLFGETGTFDVSVNSGYWRMLITETSFGSLISNPLGVGYDRFHSLLVEGAAGNSLFMDIAAMGIEFAIVLVFALIVPAFENRKNMLTFILVIFLYINTTMAQSNILYPALIVLCLVQYERNYGKRKVIQNENSMVHKQSFTGNIT